MRVDVEGPLGKETVFTSTCVYAPDLEPVVEWAKYRVGLRYEVRQPWPPAGFRIFDNLLVRELSGAFYGAEARERAQRVVDRLNVEDVERRTKGACMSLSEQVRELEWQ